VPGPKGPGLRVAPSPEPEAQVPGYFSPSSFAGFSLNMRFSSGSLTPRR